MTATKISLYNGALILCKARRIASLSVDEESRYVLDDVWDRGAVDTCLEQGLWNHAMRTGILDKDTGYSDPLEAGWNRFTKPSDWIRVAGVWTDQSFTNPALRYQDEGNYLYSFEPTLYVRYISNDASYGTNYSLWPKTFERYVEAYLATQIIGRITGGQTDKQTIDQTALKALRDARSKDAMREPTSFPPETMWNSSRRGLRNGRSRRDYSGIF